jgi:hypothetical protein
MEMEVWREWGRAKGGPVYPTACTCTLNAFARRVRCMRACVQELCQAESAEAKAFMALRLHTIVDALRLVGAPAKGGDGGWGGGGRQLPVSCMCMCMRRPAHPVPPPHTCMHGCACCACRSTGPPCTPTTP